MMKLLRNRKLASWVVGIVGLGLVVTYIPLIFIPTEPSSPVDRTEPAPTRELPFASTTAPVIVDTSTASVTEEQALQPPVAPTSAPTGTPYTPSPLLR
jgi:hypothetical protein